MSSYLEFVFKQIPICRICRESTSWMYANGNNQPFACYKTICKNCLHRKSDGIIEYHRCNIKNLLYEPPPLKTKNTNHRCIQFHPDFHNAFSKQVFSEYSLSFHTGMYYCEPFLWTWISHDQPHASQMDETLTNAVVSNEDPLWLQHLLSITEMYDVFISYPDPLMFSIEGKIQSYRSWTWTFKKGNVRMLGSFLGLPDNLGYFVKAPYLYHPLPVTCTTQKLFRNDIWYSLWTMDTDMLNNHLILSSKKEWNRIMILYSLLLSEYKIPSKYVKELGQRPWSNIHEALKYEADIFFPKAISDTTKINGVGSLFTGP